MELPLGIGPVIAGGPFPPGPANKDVDIICQKVLVNRDLVALSYASYIMELIGSDNFIVAYAGNKKLACLDVFQDSKGDVTLKQYKLVDYLGPEPRPDLIGGWSKPRAANNEDQQMFKELQQKLEMTLDEKFSMFTGLMVSSQMVAGTNYYVEISVDDGGKNDLLRVNFFRTLSGDIKLGQWEYGTYQADNLELQPGK